MDKVEALAETTGSEMNESVLLVCPYPHEQDALYDLLASRYRTCIAPSAEAALAETANDFDLVIIDTTDESHSWEDDVRLFREHKEDIKVLALADGKDDAITSAVGQAEINSAVIKPYAFDDLLLRVRRLLGVVEIEGRVLRSVFRSPLL
jgi:DNA-binding response OmpR family regulator